MMTFKRLISPFALFALFALTACGGGGGSAGTSPLVPTPVVTGSGSVAALDVQLSSPTIPNSGVGTVTATITAVDANRNAVGGAAVTVSVDSGLIAFTGTGGSVTDSAGRILANVSIGSNRSNRAIVVTATAGSVAAKATLNVVDSTSGATPASVELIAGATTVGTGGDGVLIRAFVKDVNNNALPSTAVTFKTSTGTLSAVSSTTDASGSATATLSSGSDRSNRDAVITVSAGAVSNQLTLPITGTKLTLSGPTAMIQGNSAAFDVVVNDSKGNVVPSVTVTATSSLKNTVSSATNGVTNSSGQARFTYTATVAGTDTLVFSAIGASALPSPALVISGQDFSFISPPPATTVAVNANQTVQVRLRSGGLPQAGQTVNFAATGGTLSAASALTDANGIAQVSINSKSAGPVTVQATVANTTTNTTLPLVIIATAPSNLVLQISPTSLAPNTTATSANQAQVVAKVTDAAGNPVQGQTVNFTRTTDPSGGNLLQASATTDSSGQATVGYRSGAQSTANNGVVLSASVANAPAVSGSATLTVNQTALFIALGTGNVITNLDPQTYQKDWVVYVTDSNGIPVNGVTLTIKLIPISYLTGTLSWDGKRWTYTKNSVYVCDNEDKNYNGILDPNEDANNDKVLWPGNVIAVTPGTVQTANGRATISLIYAESYVPWVSVKLTASATVTGTESRTDASFIVDGAASDFNVETAPPAGTTSPFGSVPKAGAVCTGPF